MVCLHLCSLNKDCYQQCSCHGPQRAYIVKKKKKKKKSNTVREVVDKPRLAKLFFGRGNYLQSNHCLSTRAVKTSHFLDYHGQKNNEISAISTCTKGNLQDNFCLVAIAATDNTISVFNSVQL